MNNPLTPYILIETLKRSNLPTILVEGNDDINIYNFFEQKIGSRKISFINCGGRNTLLKIYEKKKELQGKKVMYIADKDMWVFSEIPQKYKDIFFTKGYSIENDLYEDGYTLIHKLFNTEENKKFEIILQELIKWFAFEITKFKTNKKYDAKFSEVSILSTDNFNRKLNKFTSQFIKNRCPENSNNKTVHEIQNNYIQKLRGKFIFQIFLLLFQERKKKNSIKPIKYTTNQLFDLCFRQGISNKQNKTNMNRLINELLKFINYKI